MTRIVFFPIGNADSTLFRLEDGRLILVDYCRADTAGEDGDKRVKLDEALRDYLDQEGATRIDVVAFTHGDTDHIAGAEDFFWFDHDEALQGEGRVQMGEIWVPTTLLIEADCAETVTAEVAYRLRNADAGDCGGVRIFGEPEALTDWLKDEELALDDVEHCIQHAGSLVPGFAGSEDGVEVFVHSPFSQHGDEDLGDRNGNSLILHFTIFSAAGDLRVLMGDDARWEDWQDIVAVTRAKRNEDRLTWDVFRLSHHCSYLSLGPDRGGDLTEAVAEVDWLFEQGSESARMIASSRPIPAKGSTEDDDVQPPHRQAAAYYRRIAEANGGGANFVVTMEWPTTDRPRPFVIDVDDVGWSFPERAKTAGGQAGALGGRSPQFG